MTPFQEAEDQSGPTNPMEDVEYLLATAAQEITSLRNNNREMRLRLDVFDQMMSLFNARPQTHQMGYSEDVVHAIRKKLDQRIKTTLAKKEKTNVANN